MYSEHLYGFHGDWLVAQVLHTDSFSGRHWRAFLSHRPVDDICWGTAADAIAAAEAAWQTSGTRHGSSGSNRPRRQHHRLRSGATLSKRSGNATLVGRRHHA